MTRFRRGEADVNEHRGRPRGHEENFEQRVDTIQSCMVESRHWSLRSLATKTGIPRETVRRIIVNHLKMKKKMGKWVPHELSPGQVEHRILACKENLRTHNRNPTRLQRTISIDETWVRLYMEPDRNQARSWVYSGEDPEPMAREELHGAKRMLIVAMDWDGIAFYELLGSGTTVNGQVYKDFLCKHIPEWLSKHPRGSLSLLHDNARPHKAPVVQELLRSRNVTEWCHPPYSPDISPLDFNCFHQLKRLLRGVHHHDWDDFILNLERAIDELNNSGRMTGIQQLPERWQRVINAEGSYI